MTITPPASIIANLKELNALVSEYPKKIPMSECAKFLGITEESLRLYLKNGKSTFGMNWFKNTPENCGYFVPTLKFYFWVIQSFGALEF